MLALQTTCEIAIGDNLLSQDWVRDLVRINKSFTVERALHSVEMLRASKRMSEYIHFAVAEKNENIWIAQRQGRAKNSNDLTQPAILKMMAMGGEGSIIDRLKQLHLVPLTISYEYDPCDYLKAREYQLRRDVPYWKKLPKMTWRVCLLESRDSRDISSIVVLLALMNGLILWTQSSPRTSYLMR